MFMEHSFDWRGLGIPPHIRKMVIYRYFMVLLLKRLKYREQMLHTAQICYSNQKELVTFLKKFNYEDAASDMPPIGAPPDEIADMLQIEFWHLSEDIVIELICIAAESLFKNADYPRFPEHPANKSEWLPE